MIRQVGRANRQPVFKSGQGAIQKEMNKQEQIEKVIRHVADERYAILMDTIKRQIDFVQKKQPKKGKVMTVFKVKKDVPRFRLGEKVRIPGEWEIVAVVRSVGGGVSYEAMHGLQPEGIIRIQEKDIQKVKR